MSADRFARHAATTRRARVGVVGLGRVGVVHAESLAASFRAELACIVDQREAHAGALAQRLGCESSTRYMDLLEDPSVEAIVVAAPTDLHAQMIEDAARAGKHIFCEKPLARDRDRSARAVAAAQAAGVLLQVGFHRRFDPDWLNAHARVARGELGDVYLLRTSLRERIPPTLEHLESAGDFFADVTIHDLDCARWLVGDVAEVAAHTATLSDAELARRGHLDHALVFLRFATGALGVIDNSRTARYGYECATELVGSRASVRIGSNQHRHNVQWLTEGAVTTDHVTEFPERFAEAYRAEMAHFVEAVRAGAAVAVTGADALAAEQLAALASRSAALGRPVTIDEAPPPTAVKPEAT